VASNGRRPRKQFRSDPRQSCLPFQAESTTDALDRLDASAGISAAEPPTSPASPGPDYRSPSLSPSRSRGTTASPTPPVQSLPRSERPVEIHGHSSNSSDRNRIDSSVQAEQDAARTPSNRFTVTSLASLLGTLRRVDTQRPHGSDRDTGGDGTYDRQRPAHAADQRTDYERCSPAAGTPRAPGRARPSPRPEPTVDKTN
jgi:hypothetical protein